MALIKKHSPKIEGVHTIEKRSVSYLLEKEQIKELKDIQLVDYRAKVMLDKSVTVPEHWSQMWMCNAEMARRFCRIVEKREAKKNDNSRNQKIKKM